MSDTLPLLIEVGCEEIPARFLERAMRDLGRALELALRNEARLLVESASGAVKTYSTPRRLIAHVSSLLIRQPDIVNRALGPSVTVAYDSEGRPTRAAEAFASKHGVPVTSLRRMQHGKGEYVYLEMLQRGCDARDILVEILPRVIGGLIFPKSMYWEPSKVRWVRPIRWILALLGEASEARVIPFEVAGVKSGRVTYGHRTLGPGPMEVTGFDDYAKNLRQTGVEFDPEKRLAIVQTQLKVLLEGSGLSVVPDQDLEEWVVNSTEWPRTLVGAFEERFLKLPREILITVMRDHQHYFAVEDTDGNLQSRFVTFLNVAGDPKGIIRHGHERVLIARFTDAEFFWNADQKVTLAERFERGWLERVTYHEKLGSYGDKVRRMKIVAKEICRAVGATPAVADDILGAWWRSRSWSGDELLSAVTKVVVKAVELCKCDLTTAMVQEFTELQGIVGGLYAKAQHEPIEVADAIYDHYRPAGVDDSCPRSVVGAVVSLADKLDTVVAGFQVGLEPTSSSDPFALRRAGNGIVKICAEKLPSLGLDGLLLVAASVFGLSSSADISSPVMKFFGERTEYYLREAVGLRYDTTRAVVRSTLGWAKPSDTRLRGLALEEFVSSADFAALSQAAKRTRNILTKSANIDFQAGRDNIKEDLFSQPEERQLFAAFNAMWSSLLRFEEQQAYRQAFRALAGMRPTIDEFFDRVHVMAEQEDVRNNRLALLNSLDALIFSRLADLSQIESNTSNVGAPTPKSSDE